MKQKKSIRRMHIYIWIVGIIILFLISGFFLGIYSKRNEVYYAKYDDYSELEYSVALKENDYFNKTYLEENRQYIASLIDYINADFNYNLNVKEDLEYLYKYKIVANVNVIDEKTNKVIFTSSENLCREKTGKNTESLMIQEEVKIDYNKYNDLISGFVESYNLKNVTNKLTVKMYVGIAGNIEDLQKEENAVISIDIPLTTDTVGIDVNYDLSKNVDNLVTIRSSYNNNKTLFYLAIFLLIMDVGLIVGLVVYMKKSLTEEEKYKGEVNKILSNYGSYISEVEDEFDMKGYQILKVKKFIDLLEIRDTMHLPIIMLENESSLATCFIIPTDNKILYFYSLGITQYALPTKASEKVEEII